MTDSPKFLTAPNIIAAFALFLLIFFTHNNSVNNTLTDSLFSIHVSMSLIKEGNSNLDEYKDVLNNHYTLTETDEHVYSFMPIAGYVIATPLVYVLNEFSESLWSYKLDEAISAKPHLSGGAQKFVSSVYVALAGVVVYFIALATTGRRVAAVVAVLLFAFCTSAWSVASRVFWIHSPSMLFVSLTLLILLLAQKNDKLARYASIPLGIAYIVRPTNGIAVLCITLYVLIMHRRQFLWYALWSLSIAAPFVLYSLNVYGAILPPYFNGGRLELFHHKMIRALVGNLFSPSRGLFIYSPFLLFIPYAVWRKFRQGVSIQLDILAMSIIFLHWAAMSCFPEWHAGHAYGPRYFTDMLPLLLFLLLPAVNDFTPPFSEGSPSPRLRKALSGVFAALCLFALVVHYRGANVPATWEWNVTPVNVDDVNEKLWSWRYPQFFATQKNMEESREYYARMLDEKRRTAE